eukprot:gnl/TRDRNA2_/TRDRNA2_36233_c0_seq1.p1 gnl/TRDRNA2_/TRDRNA2_36233_c0~~gnl/TRDRNA2_/TRDRNA2_36233_c0_seq1.p1  ORF type:complete len:391 (+),score=106.24 gnl/TRDRNA2_/TRDRNA2_36233_c0_seq1:70-1242(+)
MPSLRICASLVLVATVSPMLTVEDEGPDLNIPPTKLELEQARLDFIEELEKAQDFDDEAGPLKKLSAQIASVFGAKTTANILLEMGQQIASLKEHKSELAEHRKEVERNIVDMLSVVITQHAGSVSRLVKSVATDIADARALKDMNKVAVESDKELRELTGKSEHHASPIELSGGHVPGGDIDAFRRINGEEKDESADARIKELFDKAVAAERQNSFGATSPLDNEGFVPYGQDQTKREPETNFMEVDEVDAFQGDQKQKAADEKLKRKIKARRHSTRELAQKLGIPKAHVQAYRNVFDHLDLDRGECLDKHELKNIWFMFSKREKKPEMQLDDREVDMATALLDHDMSGYVDFPEFVDWLRSPDLALNSKTGQLEFVPGTEFKELDQHS